MGRPYNVIYRVNGVFYRIQRHHRARIVVVHLDRVAPYVEDTRDEQP
jgi:hypothetical protein